jgi:hypothetical protein
MPTIASSYSTYCVKLLAVRSEIFHQFAEPHLAHAKPSQLPIRNLVEGL